MHHGITYRGKHSDEFYTVVRTKGRPITAPQRHSAETVPQHDGDIDVSSALGRIYFDDKILELEFDIMADNTTQLQSRVSKFASWIAGDYDELIFDDLPYAAFIAKPYDLDAMTINLFKNGNTSIQFRCKPFNRFIYDSTQESIVLGAAIPLGADIPLNLGAENNIVFASGTTTYTLYYYGTAPVRPVATVSLSSSGGTFTLGVNGDEMTTTAASATTIEIDSGEASVSPTDVSGEFFELVPGENTITITSTSAGTLSFYYKHNFLYGI